MGPRQGRYVSFDPFYVKGPAYGGLVGESEPRDDTSGTQTPRAEYNFPTGR
jgi:hypothetical protein